MVKFSGPMKYYKDKVYEFNIPAGHSCPQAVECLVKVDRETGKMANGKEQRFRCYAAQNERFPSAREMRWKNFDQIRKSEDIATLISSSIPKNAKRIRIHGSGDFFNQEYFDAWLEVCRQHPTILFWAFTKSVSLWINRLDSLPENLVMQASWGGREDHLITEHGLKSATVFPTVEAALASGLPIDVDDYYACTHNGSFALVDNFGPDKGARIYVENLDDHPSKKEMNSV
jgi:hypothetical protein